MLFFKKASKAKEPEKKGPQPPRFVARLKKDIGAEIWAVSQEDHFIRVYGEKGEDRILYRFSDAVHDLREFNGTRIDLDHWVLSEAIEKTEKVGDSYEVVLKNGKRFPVSESYRRVLQEMEWGLSER